MTDYELTISLNGKFYCRIALRADFKDEAIKQANEIMNRFPEPEFKATLKAWQKVGETVCWFN